MTIPCMRCFYLITPSLVALKEKKKKRKRERERESIEICGTNGINISYSKHLLCRSVLVITAK